MKRRSSAMVAIAALLVVGCATVATTRTVSDNEFLLSATVPRLSYHTNEAIDVTASLTYTGAKPEVTVDGLDWGLVTIWFKLLDGSLSMAPLSRLMCSRTPVTLTKGVAKIFPALKVAGYEGGVSTTAFYQAWNADPLVHLPVGRWQVDAHLTSCGGTGPDDPADHNLTTPPLVLTVTP